MAYLRYPHLHGDTLVFTAEDDVWTAPTAGGRAYRLTADGVPVASPRISPDGARVAWTSGRDGTREVYTADVEGGGVRRLTWWGDWSTGCAGWTPGGEVVAVSGTGEATGRRWAFAVPPDGGSPRRLPYGPLTAVALGDGAQGDGAPGDGAQGDGAPGDGAPGAGGAVATLSGGGMDAAWWKRYRGGTAGRLWLDPDGSGAFVRIAGDLDGQPRSPMLVRSGDGLRLAFLSDHEGWGNLYSVALDGGDLRRHSDHGADGAPSFYARHASTDGERVVYESAGRLYLVRSLEAGSAPEEIEVRLGGPRSAREPFRADRSRDLASVRPDRTGRASVVGVRGTVHRLTHRDGPARALLAEPGVRARMAQPLGDHRAVWVDDAEGEDAVCVAPLDAHAEDVRPLRRYSAGRIGRVLELTAAPDGSAVALTTHDGRLLVVHLDTPAPTPDAGGSDDAGPAGDGPGGAGTDDPAPDSAVEPGAAEGDPGGTGPGAGGSSVVWPDGTLRELTRGAAGEVFDLCWSPDGVWLAFCDPPEPGLSRIVLARVRDGELHEATTGRFFDSDPVFTLDGKYLTFLSRRVFDPTYDLHSFDLTFQTGWKPFLIPLAARTPSPFGAGPDGRPVSPEDEKPEDPPAVPSTPDGEAERDGVGDAETTASTKEKKDKAKKPPEVVVDPEGLAERVVGVPVEAARYVALTAVKDALLWRHVPPSGVLGDSRADDEAERDKPWLERYDLVKRTLTTIADPGGPFAVSGDGTRVVTRDEGKIRVLRTDRSSSSAPQEGDADEFEVDTRRLVVTIDPGAEWHQMFDEAARLMRDHFWVADMAGVDWDAEVARYRPVVDRVGSHDDLVDVLWELQGELGTSHAYVIGGGRGPGGDPTGAPGLLGADLEPGGDGGWAVRRVLPPDSSSPGARSPLTGPGVDVRAGDVVLEVGGLPVDPDWGPAPLLLDRAGRHTELTVRSGPDRDDAGTVRRVVVRPLRSEDELRYQDWVAGRRAAVAERSGGRLGYLHVPDMVASGWAQLHRDLARETARDGLVLDVRGNRGGHTSQLVVEKLARTVIGWDLPRHRRPSTYPEDAPRGPVVALADELSGSDGDIVTAAIKRLGVGPVVGVRTWGGVIGIDGRYRLVDGTRVTQPRYATWFDDVGWGMENHGVDPDEEVVITPQDWVAGRDPQLDRAVDLALERLAEHPPARPPDVGTRPSRERPALPPRP